MVWVGKPLVAKDMIGPKDVLTQEVQQVHIKAQAEKASKRLAAKHKKKSKWYH